MKKTVNEKASENAENVSEDAEKSDAPATEAAPAAAEENASAGQAEEAHASGVSAEYGRSCTVERKHRPAYADLKNCAAHCGRPVMGACGGV